MNMSFGNKYLIFIMLNKKFGGINLEKYLN